MEGSGQVLAFDLTEEKVQILNQNAERAGLAGMIRGETGDATVFRQELEGSADLVIADLPCSGLGVLGQKPDIRLNLKEEQIPELAALQRTMLGQAARYVRPGGKLLFSTCTISRRENEDNRAWFLETHPEFRPEPVETGESLFPGLSGRPELSEGYLQMLPGEFPCDGFFFALFRRTE
jgi:16S rRNA (cytosine967-C5)-methyltransferase